LLLPSIHFRPNQLTLCIDEHPYPSPHSLTWHKGRHCSILLSLSDLGYLYHLLPHTANQVTSRFHLHRRLHHLLSDKVAVGNCNLISALNMVQLILVHPKTFVLIYLELNLHPHLSRD